MVPRSNNGHSRWNKINYKRAENTGEPVVNQTAVAGLPKAWVRRENAPYWSGCECFGASLECFSLRLTQSKKLPRSPKSSSAQTEGN